MRYVKRIEDTDLWRKQFENTEKGGGHIDGDYYIVNQSGRGESTQVIPPVAQDIIAAKSKIVRKRKKNRRYKRKATTKKRYKKPKPKRKVNSKKRKFKKRKNKVKRRYKRNK